ncbi:MAG: hypothetical protein PHX44_01365 [Sulfurimonas sp.]|uniref:hypothetical protein n=1 Tax=Sulfurimonas sp. TaxID=2022749 RepID=UPI002634B124|nr:hypothetical protein [Sulfurimonas sp.]MDD2651682.1 hypothetical protein [Sulfurimonas sp.]MDD3451493.1 hypothetical protein [Sulfurimonas sp.]
MKTPRYIISSLLIGAVSLLVVGCAGKPISFKSVPPQKYENVKDKGREISASASGFQLLLFIPIDINDRHERAYQLLKAQAGDGYMTNIRIEESWTYAFVGTSYKTTLKATLYPRE